jgi:hypothetical protein
MNLTRTALATRTAALAGYPQCCADTGVEEGPVVTMVFLKAVSISVLLLNPQVPCPPTDSEARSYARSVLEHVATSDVDEKGAPGGVAFYQLVISADGRVSDLQLLAGRPAHGEILTRHLVGRILPPPPVAQGVDSIVVPLACLFGKRRQTEPELVAGLGRQECLVRLLAASSISGMKFHSRPTVDALTRALQDPSPRVRKAAASGLGRIGRHGRRSVPSVCPLLADPDSEVRAAAAWASEKCAQGER